MVSYCSYHYVFDFSGAKIRIIFRSTKCLADFLVIFFGILVFQGTLFISISTSLPRRMRVPTSVEKTAKGTAAMVIEPSGEYVTGYVERVVSMVSPG